MLKLFFYLSTYEFAFGCCLMVFRRFVYTLLPLLAKVLGGLASFFVYLLLCFFFWEVFFFVSVFEDWVCFDGVNHDLEFLILGWGCFRICFYCQS